MCVFKVAIVAIAVVAVAEVVGNTIVQCQRAKAKAAN